MANFPLINGNRYDFSSVEVVLSTLLGRKRIIGLKELSYGDGLEPGMVYGAHAQPIGRTRGQYKSEASMTLFRQEYDELITSLGLGFMEASFEVHVAYADDNQPTVKDVIVGCRISKADKSASGTDALEVKLTLSTMYVTHNGLSPIRKMLGSPNV